MKKKLTTETCRLLCKLTPLLIQIMKRSLILCIMFFSMTTFSFSQKISIKMHDVRLYEALKEIKKEANVDFFYSDKEVDVDRIVSVNFTDTDVVDIVYSLVGNSFNVKETEDGIILISPLFTGPASQNDIIVNGSVKDAEGLPLAGVTIAVKGLNRGDVSDFDGNFSIKASKESTLVFSYVGYKTQEIPVNGRTEINVQLQTDVSKLDEVVITGIVERKKETYTGTVNTITGDELRSIGNQNIIQSMKTLDPSFIVLENNLEGSNPNVLPNIEVRGQTSISTDEIRDEYGADPNSPLFVLDGFETNLRTIVDLDMNRVASITILKDAASTALYGSKAANGVVVVETKKPEAGKIRLSYSGDFSVDMADLTDYNLMNSEEKLEFERLSGRWTDYVNTPRSQIVLDSLYNVKLADIKRGVDTYWLSEPLQTAFTQKHAVYADGGSDDLRFTAGLNYRHGEGVMKGSDRNTWGANVDLIYRKKNINISNRLYVSGVDANESNYGSFANFAQANPYYKKYNEEGEITRYLDTETNIRGYSGVNVVNPLYLSTINNSDNTKQFNIQNNLGFIWTLNSNLRFQGGGQLRKFTSRNEMFLAPESTVFDNTNFFEKGQYTRVQSDAFSYIANAMLVYHNVFGEKHSLTGNLRTEIEEQNNENYTTVAVGFPSGTNGNPSFAFSYDPDSKPSFSTTKYRRNNIMGSLNYSYNNKYLFDANYRLDGSTVFGSNEKYSPFWSVGLGWNLHKEFGFDDVFDLFRIRQTFGYTGNQNLGSVASTSVYSYQSLVNYFGTGLGLTTYANPDLEWQRTFDMNLGVDIAFLDNRFDAQFNVYKKKTNPLVVPVNLAASTGLVAYPLNVGYLEVDGFEVITNFKIINDFENQVFWRIGATAAILNMEYGGIGNALQNLDEDALDSGSLRRYRDGGSPDDIWAVPSLGIDPSTGREVFLKKNGQSTFDFDYEDEVIVGSTRAKAEGVISNYFTYKEFNFGVNLRYRFGGQSFNTALYDKVENISTSSITLNQDRRALYDRWQEPGDIARFKSISITETTPISSRFVQDNNVLIGESLNLGYVASNKDWLDNIGLKSLRVTAYMNDFFRTGTIEVERGINYPFTRTVSLSLNALF